MDTTRRIKSKKYTGVYFRHSARQTFRGKPDRIYWICYRVRGKLKWHRVGRASEGITEEYANRKRVELLNLAHLGESPTLRKTKVVTFGEVFTAYIETARVDGKHVDIEVNRYKKHIKKHFADAGLDEFTDAVLTKYKSILFKRGLSPSSVKQTLALMRRTVNYGLRTRMWSGVNPLSGQAGFIMPKVENKGERWFTPQEVEAIFEDLEKRNPMVKDMAELSLRLGLRATELFRLRGMDVDAAAMTLYVVSKGGKRTPVRVHDRKLVDMLLAYNRQPGEFIFQQTNGAKLTQIPRAFYRTIKKLGLNDGVTERTHKVWFHVFRHTWASWLAQSGQVSLFELMQLGRWTRIETVMRYAHLMPNSHLEKLRLIDQRLAEGRQDHRPSRPDARLARPRNVRVRTARASGSA